jgi:hypothetical protein
MRVRPLEAPLAGEQVVGASPKLAPVVDPRWQRRLNLYSGRSLSDTALTVEQEGRAGRLAMAGRGWSHGIVAGLEVGLEAELVPAPPPEEGETAADDELRWYLHVGAGMGLTAHGEDVTVAQNLRVSLDDMHIFLVQPPPPGPAPIVDIPVVEAPGDGGSETPDGGEDEEPVEDGEGEGSEGGDGDGGGSELPAEEGDVPEPPADEGDVSETPADELGGGAVDEGGPGGGGMPATALAASAARPLPAGAMPTLADYRGAPVAQVGGAPAPRPSVPMAPQPRALGAVRKTAHMPRAAVLLLRPVTAELVGSADPTDPCELDPADEAYADWQLADGAHLVLYAFPWQDRVAADPAPSWRNRLAYEVFSAEAELEPGRVLPWEEVGVPLALIGFGGDGEPLWVDGWAVARDGGRPERGTPLMRNVGHPLLWQARLKQFAEQVAEVDWKAADPKEEFAKFHYLPPAGLLPRAAVNLEAGTTPIFPGDYVVEAVPVPLEQLDAAIEASAALRPFDRTEADRARILVPVPHALYDPRLLQRERPDPQFQLEIESGVRERAELVARREEVRRKVETIIHAATGRVPAFPRPEDDPERLEDEAAAHRLIPIPIGTKARQSSLRPGLHQHGLVHADETYVSAGDLLFAWVHPDPANPPTQLFVQWEDEEGDLTHRAVWGPPVQYTPTDRYMGAVPPAGRWTRLEVPAHAVRLEEHTVITTRFGMVDGRATWDRWGRFPSTDEVWVDEAVPAGAQLDGEGVTWVTENPTPFSGTVSRRVQPDEGQHEHAITHMAPLLVDEGDVLYAYVWLDPANPPQQVMVQWYSGNWEHRAYWGANRLDMGVDGTPSRLRVGPLPAPGEWARLEVPAADVGLAGQAVMGITFTLFDGAAAWDRTGRRMPTGSGLWGEYFADQDMLDLRVARLDPVVNFTWASGRPDPRVQADGFAARWTGFIVAPDAGEYTFVVRYDDGVRLWMDGRKVVDDWEAGIDAPERSETFKRTLEKDQRVEVRLEYVDRAGVSRVQLAWGTATQAIAPIPPAALFPPDALGQAGLVRPSEQVWVGAELVSDPGMQGRESVEWVTHPALHPPEPAFGTGNRRSVHALSALKDKLFAGGLFSHTELESLETHGIQPFAERLAAAVRRSDDFIDFGFTRVQTDLYRLREQMLGKDAALKLATSPALAAVLRNESALGQREQLNSYLAGMRAEAVAPAENDATTAGTGGIAFNVSRVDAGAGFLVANTADGGMLAGSALRLSGLALSGGTVSPPITSRTVTPTGAAALSPAPAELSPTRLRMPTSSSAVDKVLFARPLIGEAHDFRTVTVAERLGTPASNETKSFAVLTRFEVLNGLKALQQSVIDELGLYLRLDDVVLPGFPKTVLDTGETERELKVGNRVFRIPIRIARTFAAVKERLDLVLEENDPVDGDEAAFFSMAVELLDATIAGLRNVEGVVQQYRDALVLCTQAIDELYDHAAQADRRLKELGDALAEARHDVAVARALYQDEMARVNAVNERRAAVIRDHVTFLAFQRPRLSSGLLEVPARPLNPAFTPTALPAALVDPAQAPPELRAVVELLREAPLRMFRNAERLLAGLDTIAVMRGTLEAARMRATYRGDGRMLDDVEARLGGALGSAIARTLAAQRQVVSAFRGKTAQMDLSGLDRLYWDRLRGYALEHLSLGDLIDAAHGRTSVDRAAARELDDALKVAASLHRAFGQVKPALRLAWAEALSQYDQAADLRDLFALPRWGEVDYLPRREMQALVDWLFGRVHAGRPEALALISDIVRVCILLASHSPVNAIVAGTVSRETEARMGGTVEVAIAGERVRVGMHALLYDVANRPVHAVIEDLGQGVAVARVVHAYAQSVTLARDTRVQLGDEPTRAPSRSPLDAIPVFVPPLADR